MGTAVTILFRAGPPFKTGLVLGLELVEFILGVWGITWPTPHLLARRPGMAPAGKVRTVNARHLVPECPTCFAPPYPIPELGWCFLKTKEGREAKGV